MYLDFLLAMMTIWGVYGAMRELGAFCRFVQGEPSNIHVSWANYLAMTIVGAVFWPFLQGAKQEDTQIKQENVFNAILKND